MICISSNILFCIYTDLADNCTYGIRLRKQQHMETCRNARMSDLQE